MAAAIITSVVLLLLSVRLGYGQVIAQFPQPITIAVGKPVTASSVCGTERRDFYCAYTSSIGSLLQCSNDVCNDTCPHSSSSPVPTVLSELGTFGSGVTSTAGRLGVSLSAFQFVDSFISIPSSNVSQIGVNGFSFAAWIKQDSGNTGTLLSKSISDGTDRTYTISVTESNVTFNYHPNTLVSGYSTLTITDSIDLTSQYWHHIAITVYQNDFALYINGTVANATGLVSSISESSNTIYIGQTAPGIQHYRGIMQDIYYYSQALTERDVKELVTNTLPYVHLSSECRCPPSHPVISSIDADRCIQHAGVTTGRGTVTRINSYSHAIGYVNDNNYDSNWISALREREVNITMSLALGTNSAFEIIFVFFNYRAPAPKAAVLQRSVDGGNTYEPWQYLADDCQFYFGLENDVPLSNPDSVNCITEYSSQMPLSDGTTRVRLLDSRIRPGDINTSPELRSFIRADHIKMSMLDFFTENTTQFYHYYSINEIIVAGRCACNGHAQTCSNDVNAICDCIHNTQGYRCDECLPLYNDKPWREGTGATGYTCHQCNCNNHASSCVYNVSVDPFPDSRTLGGGGVCIDCQDNTDGRYCESCVDEYYRPPGVNPSAANPCLTCGCDSSGSSSSICVKNEGIPGQVAGQCSCKQNTEGRTCSDCKSGFFNLSSDNPDGCQTCNCNTDGTIGGSETCNVNTGQCSCKLNVEGLKCDQCINGTRGLSASNINGCSACTCNSTGSVGTGCNPVTGQCDCKPGVTGLNCDRCSDGFHSFSEGGCQACLCSDAGSVNNTCSSNGICTCSTGFTGDLCSECDVGFFNLSAGCPPCSCNSAGTIAGQANQCNATTGQCSCRTNVQGRKCDTCITNFTNLQESNSLGCSACDCVLSNTNSSVSGSICDPVSSQCSCLSIAFGLQCQLCQDGFYSNGSGACVPCQCNEKGSFNSTCDYNGQCFCNGTIGRTCNSCSLGQYGFPNCLTCQCNSSGSLGSVCNETTGECQCKQFVTGMNCNTCLNGYQSLQAENPFGCSKAPEEQSPPSLMSRTPVSIEIAWSPPELPNGVINLYRLYRNGTLIASVSSNVTVYNDTAAELTPNTVYMYQVESVNIAGEVRSDGISILTLEGTPAEVNPPVLTLINATSIQAQWQAPNISNGAIAQYRLDLVAIDGLLLETALNTFSGLAFSTVVSGLRPYSLNTFVLQACTSFGCSDSEPVSIRTSEAAPTFQPAPNVTAINSTSIQITWAAPDEPNGIITMYEIYQRNSPFTGTGAVIKAVPSNIRSVVITGLEPFTAYQYSVTSHTSAGGTQSVWIQERTDEDVPEDVIDPELSVISSTEIRISWSSPLTPNGIITEYRLFLLYSNGSITSLFNDTQSGTYVVSGLTPFTEYQFYMLVCNSAGCGISNTVQQATFESVPVGLSPPLIDNVTGTSVQVSWTAPAQPNGVITSYNITRTRPSLLSSPLYRDFGVSFYGTGFTSFSPIIPGLVGPNTAFSFMFKTLQPDGVLLYSINAAQTDLLALELRDGIPWFLFDAGSGTAAVTLNGSTTFNDGLWHSLVVSRTGRNGVLTVDGIHTGSGTSPPGSTFFGTPSVFHVGGIPADTPLKTVASNLNTNATLEGHSFAGCLFNVRVSSNMIDFNSQLDSNSGVGLPGSGCPVNLEHGVSFIGGGHLETAAFTSPGSDSFSLSISFRTRYPNGLLLFAHGVNSHILLALRDSNVILSIKGSDTNAFILSTATLSFSEDICNGQWHSIQLTKESDGIILTVDEQSVSQAFPSLSLVLQSNLFISGIPTLSSAYNAYNDIMSEFPSPFSGCMRDLNIENALVDFSNYVSQRHVRFFGCEDTSSNSPQCQQERVFFSTGGLITNYNDSTVNSFTEYIYQITAINSAGGSNSDWSTTVTKDSVPRGVGLPSIEERTSSTLLANWERPSESNGLITSYEIEATPVSSVGLESPLGSAVTVTLDITQPNQSLALLITGLYPATNYSLVLSASTSFGTGTASSSTFSSTLEDIPIGVQSPTVTVRSATSLQFTAAPPTQPNGVIISYRLFIANMALTFSNGVATAQNLQPFTRYDFSVEACTAIGCSNSSLANTTTLGAPPIGLDPPVLNELSPTSIGVTWSAPDYPNGLILYYTLIQMFGGEESVVFNGSSLSAVVSQLTPNTLYRFKVVAYNVAGSVSSNFSVVTTPEDSPDQLLSPNVTEINSSSIYISWSEPLLPNGNIVNYTLLLGGVPIFSGLQFSYTATNLQPFTEYMFSIQACTIQGCSSSAHTTVMTGEAVPEEYVAPTVTVITAGSLTVQLNEVGRPNGVVYYVLTVTGEFLLTNVPQRQVSVETRVVFNSSAVGNVVVSGLVPFSQYQLQLTIVNSAGSLQGDLFNVSTGSSAPEAQEAPALSLVAARTISVSWSPPLYPNGIITGYTVTVTLVDTGSSLSFSYPSNTTTAVVEGLSPFTDYRVTITATNIDGSVTSDASNITTGETAPSAFDQVTVLSKTAYSLFISWDPPASPNGVILNYTVLSGSVSLETVESVVFEYNITGLMPFTTYSLSVLACNSAGCITSPAVNDTTNEAAPEGVPRPVLFATTSGFVIITWSAPGQPNGIIRSYTLYKALLGQSFTTLATISASSELRYNDSDVQPFTLYRYYIEATNDAGSTSGEPRNVTTSEAAPEGVIAPTLQLLSSSSILVTIFPPTIPNGIIVEYILTRREGLIESPLSITISVSDPLHTNITYTDTGLSPYTNYTYSLVACTGIDCSMSGPPANELTLEALPTGIQAPFASLQDDTSLVVAWQAPSQPNGVVTSYTIVRAELGFHVKAIPNCCQQYLSGNMSDYCTLVTQTQPDVTSTVDTGLSYFSNYQYCVIVANGAGSVSSDHSTVVRTRAAPQPVTGPNATVVAINSTAVYVTWTALNVDMLLGPFVGYSLQYTGDDGVDETIYNITDEEYTLVSLTPNTDYTVSVNVSNGRGSAAGRAVTVRTLDGVPFGLLDPQVNAISATSLLIYFEEPLNPNGLITLYAIYLNSMLVHNQTTPGSYLATGLKPYTLYTAQLEVCTSFGCNRSGHTSNRTLESAPAGFASPTVTVLGPYSAYISWVPPAQPNGIITEYLVYIRVEIACPPEAVGACYNTSLLSSGIYLNYTATDLSPATEYGFAITAVNGGGNMSSGFTVETTEEAPPTFVQVPSITPVSSTELRVNWQAPTEPNGIIISYSLYRNGTLIFGPSQNILTYLSGSLDPFTVYSYTVQACTSAGCTNSSAATETTLEAPPTGFANPLISDVGAASLTVSWTPPTSPNGLNIYYEVYHGNDSFITNTSFTSINIIGLSPFTNYSFYIGVCNSAGCTLSETVSMVTNESLPVGVAITSISALSFDMIEIAWTPPTQPNGIILYYVLRRDDAVIFQNNTLQYVDTNLEGGVSYSYSIEAVNGAGGVTSAPISVTTPTASPTGISPPVTSVLNATAIYVQWTAPEKANGDIESYRVFVNNTQMFQGLTFSTTLTALSPFTTYIIRIQVCTTQGDCGSSTSVTNTTEEARPGGVSDPTVVTVSSSEIRVSWQLPSMPNGVITFYRVMRRPIDNPLAVIFAYAGGPNVFTFTDQSLTPFTRYEYQLAVVNGAGATPSSWVEAVTLEALPMGVSIPTFPEVFALNVTVAWNPPTSPNGIITRYDVFYRTLLGSFVLASSVAGNITESTIVGLQPFSTYEVKIRAHNSVGNSDSEIEVVVTSEAAPEMLRLLSLLTRTSESLQLTWLPPGKPNGVVRQYALYLDGVEEYRGTGSVTTYTVTRLRAFTGYSLVLEACTSAGCTMGQTQGFTTAESVPVGQPAPTLNAQTSRSVLVSWDPPVQENGIIRSYEVFRMQVLELQALNSTDGAFLIQSSFDVSVRLYNDTGLTPSTGYQYAVRANNSVGFSTSAFVYIQTPEDSPENVPAPTVSVLGTDRLRINWDPPLYPNGEISLYELFRVNPDNVTIIRVSSSLNREYTDTGLLPYMRYSYFVKACTQAGCTNGSIASNTTDESIPSGFSAPVLTALSSSLISVSWQVPAQPNGIITRYIVSITSPVNITVPTQQLSMNFTNLQPFTNYTVAVQACTVIGCITADPRTIVTLESIPLLIAAPLATASGPTSISVSWSPPAQPNGIIIRYILRRNGTLVYDGSGNSFEDTGLLPSRSYVYDIQAFTSVGGGERSSVAMATTLSDTPTDVDAPVLSALSSTAVLASWTAPGTPNGVIQQYILYVTREGDSSESTVYTGLGTSFLLGNLMVFTNYSFRVEACTTTCGTSSYSSVVTLEASPEGQAPPTLQAFTNETVLVTWQPPSSPNGVLQSYSLQRRQVLGEGSYGTVINVASVLSSSVQQYLDTAVVLEPALTFQYRVGVANSVGSVTSQYSDVTLPDAPPEGVSAPELVNKTFNSIALSVNPPSKSNGLVTLYRLHSTSFLPYSYVPASQSDVALFHVTGLSPYTSYSLYADTCTSAGCTSSSSVSIQTDEAAPTALSPLLPTVTSSTSIRLDWSPPVNPNGIITRYSLWYRLPCPQPQVYPVEPSCSPIDYQFLANTVELSYQFTSTGNVAHPRPYKSYQFLLQAENSAGAVNSTDSNTVTTLDDVPQVVGTVFFNIFEHNQSISLNWSSTFQLNGVLSHFIVIRDGFFLLQGTQTFAVFGNQPVSTVLQFSVKAVTSRGEVTTPTSPLFISGPATTGGEPVVTSSPTLGTTEPTQPESPFYEQFPFIVGMIVLALIVCFVCFLILLCFIRPSSNRQDKYDVLTLKSQGSPVRDDGTVRASWAPIVEPSITPAPSYHDTTGHTRSSTRMKSYSPSKVALLSQDFNEGDIPLQDTHIKRLSNIDISAEAMLGPPPLTPVEDVPEDNIEGQEDLPAASSVVPSSIPSPNSTLSRSPPPEDSAFMDTKI